MCLCVCDNLRVWVCDNRCVWVCVRAMGLFCSFSEIYDNCIRIYDTHICVFTVFDRWHTPRCVCVWIRVFTCWARLNEASPVANLCQIYHSRAAMALIRPVYTYSVSIWQTAGRRCVICRLSIRKCWEPVNMRRPDFKPICSSSRVMYYICCTIVCLAGKFFNYSGEKFFAPSNVLPCFLAGCFIQLPSKMFHKLYVLQASKNNKYQWSAAWQFKCNSFQFPHYIKMIYESFF